MVEYAFIEYVFILSNSVISAILQGLIVIREVQRGSAGIMGVAIIEVELSGVIQSQQTTDAAECIIQDIKEDYSETMVFASDARFRAREDVDLRIFLPAERSPVKCAGRIVWHSEDVELSGGCIGYFAQVIITHISRMDRRRFDLFIVQKKASISSGRGLSLALCAR